MSTRTSRRGGACRAGAALALAAWLCACGGDARGSGEWYDLPSAQFKAKLDAFVAAGKVGERDGTPIVAPPPGGDAYLLFRPWSITPVLQLRHGETYRIHVSSIGLQHGFSLQPIDVDFSVSPDHVDVLTLTAPEPGTIDILPQEFCGMGHPDIDGTILVE